MFDVRCFWAKVKKSSTWKNDFISRIKVFRAKINKLKTIAIVLSKTVWSLKWLPL